MVDYSSWKTIELSSDEDDVHPFIENGTLFRLRHEARLRKMEERKNQEFAYECHKANYTDRLDKLTAAMQEGEKIGADIADLELQLNEMQLEGKQLKEKEEKLKKQVVSWYVDTICHPGFSKMFVNGAASAENDTSPEKLHDFVAKNKSLLKRFCYIDNVDDTKVFLRLHPQIMQKQTLYFMISYGMKIYVKGKKEKLKNIARQIVYLQHVLELFRMYNRRGDDILLSFFRTVKLADERSVAEFDRETSKVQKLIKTLVKSKLQEIISSECGDESVDNSDTKELHCDAEEVFQSLPEDMQYCFITRDKDTLAKILANMSAEEAKHYMNRCIESGLWIPDKNDVNLLAQE